MIKQLGIKTIDFRNLKSIPFLLLTVVFSLSAAQQPFLYSTLTSFYSFLHFPIIEKSMFNGLEMIFPSYFFTNILFACISTFCFLYFCNNSFDAYSGTFIRSKKSSLKKRPPFILYVFSVLVYFVILILHLKNQLHSLQLNLAMLSWCMILYYAYKKDRLTGIVLSDNTFLMKYELPIVFIFSAIFVFIYASDLSSWKYSYIAADEYSFWHYGSSIVNPDTIPNPFSGKGVFDYHPVFSSLWQALFIKIGGYNSFAWKLSSAVIPPLTFIPLYLWTLLVFGRRAAVFASVSFIFAQGVMAFGHLGYNNVQSLLPFTLSLLFCELALRKNSLLFICLCAFSAAAGWYTFYTSRLACVVIALYYIISPYRKNLSISKLLFGIILFILSILFIFLEPGAIRDMFNQTITGASWAPSLTAKITVLIVNFIHAIFSFVYISHESHITIISLMDCISCIGIIISIIWLVSSLKSDWRARLIVSIFLILIIIIGTISQFGYLPVTRIFFLSLIFSVMAGIGWSKVSDIIITEKNSTIFRNIFVTLLAIACALTAAYRFYITTPSQNIYLRQAYFIELIQHHAKEKKFVIVDTASDQYLDFKYTFEINKLCYGAELVSFSNFKNNIILGKYRGKLVAINENDLANLNILEKYSFKRHTIKDLSPFLNMVYYFYDFSDSNCYQAFSDIIQKGKTSITIPSEKLLNTESGYNISNNIKSNF